MNDRQSNRALKHKAIKAIFRVVNFYNITTKVI